MHSHTLPNQLTTWSGLSTVVEEFSAWQRRTGKRYASEETELLSYLMDQLEAESGPLVGAPIEHPVLGLLSYMSIRNNRMRELLYAYLAIVVTADVGPARKLIAGQRLAAKLLPAYVTATRCYGTDQGAA